ncbi:hypothetical protein [Microlunatus flavus]|uniref:hypothetical protein n=1 Tax=Microlunatus flavus TaxID=1036181 RepID=UPI000B874599|nr:hypothetical protein [Microlunatus flavus]
MAALGTETLTEVAGLAAGTLRLLRRRGPVLVGWFCLGWAIHRAGLFVSALLGVDHAVLANLVFVLAVVAELVALVVMVHSVRPELDVPETSDDDAGAPTPVGPAGLLPPSLLAQERTLDVVTLAVGPFLAVYAVWGFLDDEVSALFQSNYVVQGLGGVQDWSISLVPARLPLYLGLAAGGWVLRALVRLWLRRRQSSSVAGVVGLVAEGVWALSVFVVLLVAARAAREWLQGRVVWAELAAAGQAVLAWLPDLTLPFGPTLREAARAVVTEAPGVLLTVVGLPLMWLALTAVVFGWREASAADALGARAAGWVGRFSGVARTPSGRVLLLATDDLRTKYLPVLLALRVVVRAGARTIGAYLLLATALQALDGLLQIGLTLLAGPQPVGRTLLLEPVEDLLVSAVVTATSVALYGAVFARALGVERPLSLSKGLGVERSLSPSNAP